MSGMLKLIRWLFYLGLTGLFVGVVAVLAVYYHLQPQLPRKLAKNLLKKLPNLKKLPYLQARKSR